MRNRTMLGIVLATMLASLVYAQPFTYQGMLKENGTPANGTFSMTFKLFDALTGGNQIGFTITRNVSVQHGLFTTTLDFGAVWNGADRYLEITVGSTVLSPRVKVSSGLLRISFESTCTTPRIASHFWMRQMEARFSPFTATATFG